MHPALSGRAAAIVVDAPLKWVDNVLSHHDLPGVVRANRGVARQIDDAGLLALALCRLLSTQLGVPLALAAVIARDAVTSRAAKAGRLEIAPGLTVNLALDDIERGIRSRIDDASEAVAHVRRGRPPLRRPSAQ